MSALPHTLPYLFECILLHNTAESLRSVVSQANIYIYVYMGTVVHAGNFLEADFKGNFAL